MKHEHVVLHMKDGSEKRVILIGYNGDCYRVIEDGKEYFLYMNEVELVEVER